MYIMIAGCVVWSGICSETGSKTAFYNDNDPDVADEADDATDGKSSETQYLIKWKHWSHIHNTWESMDSLREQNVNGMKKLDNYCKRNDELQKWYVRNWYQRLVVVEVLANRSAT